MEDHAGHTYLLKALNASLGYSFTLVPPKARILVELHESLGDGSLQTREFQQTRCLPGAPLFHNSALPDRDRGLEKNRSPRFLLVGLQA